MARVEDLMAKALSTSSDEEAIACLKMARKRGGTPPASEPSVKGPSVDTIRQVSENIKHLRAENMYLRQNIMLLEDRYQALQKQNDEISKKHHQSLGSSIALLFFAVGVVLVAALI